MLGVLWDSIRQKGGGGARVCVHVYRCVILGVQMGGNVHCGPLISGVQMRRKCASRSPHIGGPDEGKMCIKVPLFRGSRRG